VPSAGLGSDGDLYIDTLGNRLYGPKTAGSWGSGSFTKGDPGTGTTTAYRTSNFTASTGLRYLTAGTITITDPSSAVAGDNYEVMVGAGTCTIGGVAFAPSRIEVIRYFNGTNWASSPLESASQTAATASSLMTRSLVGDEQFFNLWNVFRPVPNPGTGSLRATAAINSDGLFYNININPSNTAANSYGRVSLSRGCNAIHFIQGGGIRFGRRLGVMLRGVMCYGGATDSTTVSRLIVGGNGGVPASSDAPALTSHGFGMELGGNGTTQSIRAFCHNGTSYTNGPWVSATSITIQNYGIISDGLGNISLLQGVLGSRPSIVSTITGGPTATGSTSTNYIDHVVVNSSTATSATLTYALIQDVVILAS
jgi:hypothetical protein